MFDFAGNFKLNQITNKHKESHCQNLTVSWLRDFNIVLTWWRTVDPDIRFPLTKVLACSMGVMLTVSWMFVITLKKNKKEKNLNINSRTLDRINKLMIKHQQHLTAVVHLC